MVSVENDRVDAHGESQFLREALRVYGTTMQLAADRQVRPPADELLRVFGKALVNLTAEPLVLDLTDLVDEDGLPALRDLGVA